MHAAQITMHQNSPFRYKEKTSDSRIRLKISKQRSVAFLFPQQQKTESIGLRQLTQICTTENKHAQRAKNYEMKFCNDEGRVLVIYKNHQLGRVRQFYPQPPATQSLSAVPAIQVPFPPPCRQLLTILISPFFNRTIHHCQILYQL
jgi:hypothetical protein